MKDRLTVVPRVVVNQSRPVGHPCNLISVVPPAHHDSVLGRVLAEPVVRLAEVVDDVLAPIGVLGCEHDGRGRVCGRRNIGIMQDVDEEQALCVGNDESATVQREDSTRLCALA